MLEKIALLDETLFSSICAISVLTFAIFSKTEPKFFSHKAAIEDCVCASFEFKASALVEISFRTLVIFASCKVSSFWIARFTSAVISIPFLDIKPSKP